MPPVLGMLYIKSKLILFFKFDVSTLSFKYGIALPNSSDLILPFPAGSVGFTVLWEKWSARVHIQPPLWGRLTWFPPPVSGRVKWPIHLEEVRSGFVRWFLWNSAPQGLPAFLWVSINSYIHKWKASWMEGEVRGEGGETGLIGWKRKGLFLSRSNYFMRHFPQGKSKAAAAFRNSSVSSWGKVWESGPLRGNTTDFQIGKRTTSIARVLWVGGTGGDDIFEPLESND